MLEKQNAQQYGAVWTTNNHLPLVSSVVESLVVYVRVVGGLVFDFISFLFYFYFFLLLFTFTFLYF